MLIDAMAARGLAARWVIQGMLTLTTAMHLGGGRNDRVDLAILRDALTGLPLLQGTSLAGALRSALADYLAGYRSAEAPEVALLFGVQRKHDSAESGGDEGSQSACIVYDAIGKLPENGGIEIRDGVAIEPKTGVAEDQKKFDYEVLPAGTTFPVRIDVLVADAQTADEQALLECLMIALDAFTHAEYGLGARRSRGLGRVTAVWSAKRFALDTEEGWLEWVCSDHEPAFSRSPQTTIEAALKVAAPTRTPVVLRIDQREKIVLALHVELAHDLLVRSPGDATDLADVVQLRSNKTPVLPGTSLSGVMRAQAFRIAELFHGASEAEALVDHIIGPRGVEDDTRTKDARASRLRISETAIHNSQSRLQTRIAIDRFTQSPVDTALFNENVEVGGTGVIELTLLNPEEGELGLIVLVVKDLLEGRLPVGGTTSVGRGILRGYANVTWYEGGHHRPRAAKLEPGKAPSGEAADDIVATIRAFQRARSNA